MQHLKKTLLGFCTYENLLVITIFLLSLIHPILLIIFFLGLMLYIEMGIEGSIKGLLLISIRTIINPVVGVPIEGSMQNIKWIAVFALSFYIILKYKTKVSSDQKIIQNVAIFFWLFIIYTGIVALTLSSYPTISIFKLFAYSFVFFSIFIGVALTYRTFDWLGYLIKILTPIFLISFTTIKLPLAYLINGVAFQGIIMHPNMFGVLSALYISLLLCKIANGEYKVIYFVMIVLNSVMSYLSVSRTGMIAIFISLLIFFFTNKASLRIKLMIFMFITALVLVFILILPNFPEQMVNYARDFIYKGNNSEILYSREGQIDTFMDRFRKHYIFGTGFSVPYVEGVKVFSFSFDKIVEPGNLVFAVLGDTGIIGFVLFLAFLINIFIRNKSYMRILFILPIAISMGEMVFFTTNTIGPILYLLYSIYIFNNSKKIINENR